MADIIHSILVIVGLALLVIGVKLFTTSRKFVKSGIKTNATVVDNIPMQSTSNNGTIIMYAPLLEYDVKGKIKNYTPNARSNPPAYDIGEKVAIVYSSKNSQNVRIVSYWGIYLGSNITIALGLPIFIIGVGYFLFKSGLI